jgi:bacterioferritin B
MPDAELVKALNKQVANEFAASQQYIAAATYYDAETLPRLAAFFYRQAVEERNHAMMFVQHLLDVEEEVMIPGIEAPKLSFDDLVGPVSMALEQERNVTGEINDLFSMAREKGDYQSEQFLAWFVKEQVEEVKTMSDLLTIVERARENPLLAEEYLSHEQPGGDAEPADAPPAAGGAL